MFKVSRAVSVCPTYNCMSIVADAFIFMLLSLLLRSHFPIHLSLDHENYCGRDVIQTIPPLLLVAYHHALHGIVAVVAAHNLTSKKVVFLFDCCIKFSVFAVPRLLMQIHLLPCDRDLSKQPVPT